MSDDKDLEIETKMMAALLANPAVVDKPVEVSGTTLPIWP